MTFRVTPARQQPGDTNRTNRNFYVFATGLPEVAFLQRAPGQCFIPATYVSSGDRCRQRLAQGSEDSANELELMRSD